MALGEHGVNQTANSMDLTVPQPLPLPDPGVVQVWQLPQTAIAAMRSRWCGWLAPEERDRLENYRQPSDRDRFLLSRGGLRYLLASYLNAAPTAIQLGYGPQGRPHLDDPAAALHFNVAHSGDWIIFGFSRCPHIGVDVEMVRPLQRLPALIRRCLAAGERANLPSDSTAQLDAFFRHWTIKEAYVKAIGLGLKVPLQQVQVALHPTPHLVAIAPVTHLPVSAWDVKLWQPDTQAIAAVCVGQSPITLQLSTLTSNQTSVVE